MISHTEFKLDGQKREILPSYSDDFPFSCLEVSLDHFVGRGWHWHPALEIDYCTEGELEYRIADGKAIILQKGDAIFINSNIMHTARAARRSMRGEIYAFLFGEVFISGTFGNLLYQKYILPLYRNSDIPYVIIHPVIPSHIHIIELLLSLPGIAEKEEYGYEFRIRDILCRLWILLIGEAEQMSGKGMPGRSIEEIERLKKMIQFIHEQYMNKITLKDISLSANLSERECNRCFKRNIQTTPIEYLNGFRVRMAAQMLSHTDNSINYISDSCGFQSASYFGRVFKKKTGKTPYEYRKTYMKKDVY